MEVCRRLLEGGEPGEVGAALVVVGLSAERLNREARIGDDMIRVGHRAGASVRQLAEMSGLGRKTVTAIVSSMHARKTIVARHLGSSGTSPCAGGVAAMAD